MLVKGDSILCFDMLFLRQRATGDLVNFMSHSSATGDQKYETLLVNAESQIAEKRTAQSQRRNPLTDAPKR